MQWRNHWTLTVNIVGSRPPNTAAWRGGIGSNTVDPQYRRLEGRYWLKYSRPPNTAAWRGGIGMLKYSRPP